MAPWNGPDYKRFLRCRGQWLPRVPLLAGKALHRPPDQKSANPKAEDEANGQNDQHGNPANAVLEARPLALNGFQIGHACSFLPAVLGGEFTRLTDTCRISIHDSNQKARKPIPFRRGRSAAPTRSDTIFALSFRKGTIAKHLTSDECIRFVHAGPVGDSRSDQLGQDS